jgi:hypothetical protein
MVTFASEQQVSAEKVLGPSAQFSNTIWPDQQPSGMFGVIADSIQGARVAARNAIEEGSSHSGHIK